jgi:hypothetical protein
MGFRLLNYISALPTVFIVKVLETAVSGMDRVVRTLDNRDSLGGRGLKKNNRTVGERA